MRLRFALLTLLTASLSAPQAQTFADAVRLYVWANEPTTASYTPSSSFSYSTSGGDITITRSSAGSYQIVADGLAGVAAGGTMMVTAYGSNAYCFSDGWSSSGDALSMSVLCEDPAGANVDTRFTAMFVSASGITVPDLLYAWASQPSTASYTPSSSYSYNASGGITIARSNPGRYVVTFAGVSTRDHVQVSSYVDAARCQAGSMTIDAAGMNVVVQCHDEAGTPADSRFTILHVGKTAASDDVGFALASSSGSASYTPISSSSYNGAGGSILATRSAPGTYNMAFDDLGGSTYGGHVQVASHGSVGTYCTIGSWGSVTDFDVDCYSASGTPTDAFYRILVVWPTRRGVATEDEPAAGALLDPARPNPTAETAVFRYHLDQPGTVRLAVYDALGREVALLAEGTRGAGDHSETLDAAPLPAGVYVVRLDAGGRTSTQTMTVVR